MPSLKRPEMQPRRVAEAGLHEGWNSFQKDGGLDLHGNLTRDLH